MKIELVTEQQRDYMQHCAELTAQLAKLLPELESGKATDDQRTAALAAAQFLQRTGDNVAFLARVICEKLDPITPANYWEKGLHGQGPQPPCFESERPKDVAPITAGAVPFSRW